MRKLLEKKQKCNWAERRSITTRSSFAQFAKRIQRSVWSIRANTWRTAKRASKPTSRIHRTVSTNNLPSTDLLLVTYDPISEYGIAASSVAIESIGGHQCPPWMKHRRSRLGYPIPTIGMWTPGLVECHSNRDMLATQRTGLFVGFGSHRVETVKSYCMS
jgi:hypothetical protein